MNNNDFEDELEPLDNESPKKKKFNIFNWYFNRSNEKELKRKPIDALKEPNVANFFKLTWRNLTKLCTTNIIFIFANIPLIFLLIGAADFFGNDTLAPQYQQWGIFNGALLFDNSPVLSTYANDFSAKVTIDALSTGSIICFCIGLLTLFTWGFANVGTKYIYRNILLGEPIFPLKDFLYIIKRNVKQCLIFGIIDALIIAMFCSNTMFLINRFTYQGNAFMLALTLIMIVLYSFMRNYAYIMIFTFNLPLRKIIKNSAYFIFLGIKRNFVAFLGVLTVIIVNIGLGFLYLLPIALILPFIITIAFSDFMSVYAVYPNIDKYMVDHSVESEDNQISEAE